MRPLPPILLVAAALVGTTISACGPERYTVEAEVDAAVSTRVVLRWATAQEGTSWVEFSSDSVQGMITPTSDEPSTEHEHFLLGLPAFEDVHYRAVTLIDGREHASEGDIQTGGLPPELPELTTTVDQPELQSDARYLLGATFGLTPVIFAVDRQGTWLWYHQLDGELLPVEIEIEREGDGILFNAFADDYTEDSGRILRLDFSGRHPWKQVTPMGHHAFTQLPGGAVAWLSLDVREWTEPGTGSVVPVVGDAVTVLAPDGETYTAFSSWDWLEPVRSEEWDSGFYSFGKDWTHANALRWEPSCECLLLGLRNLETVLELDVDTETWEATPARQFEGIVGAEVLEANEIHRITNGDHSFDYLHHPTVTSDGELMAMVEHNLETHAVTWSIDDQFGALTETWSYGQGEELRSLYLAMASELPNGNRLLTYASEGIVREVTPSGEIAWELQSSAGAVFANTLLFDDFYEPGG
jgi:hypothetical protein